MLCINRRAFAAIAVMTTGATAGAALTPPISEDFESGAAGWTDNITAPLTEVAGGGWDGGAYVSTQFNFSNAVDGDTPVLFRGETSGGNASNGAFKGDWIADGITEFSFWVRHDAAAPIAFFTRFSPTARFPGGTAIAFAPVFANTWTEVTFSIDPMSRNFVTFEGGTFEQVFSDMSNLQIGVAVDGSLAGVTAPITFDLDFVRAVPAPGASLALVGAMAATRRRR